MSVYLRRLVSGSKARYRDDGLNIELDLAYVTDRIIVMGFPAVGVESFYRNHRTDVQRFLSARHGSNFWVFNFCPLRENSYHESIFDGRVSRYPFPDHHVPPFSYLRLVTREMHAWLSGSDARVAVLHCKAGKGRSGTLACAYLLLRCVSPSAPMPSALDVRFSDWSLISDKEGLQTPLPDASAALPDTICNPLDRPVDASLGVDLSRVSSEPVANALEKVLDLHTARRMKPPSRLPKKPKMGVSIPSQQRWLFYWSQVLTGKGPPETLTDNTSLVPKVRLTKLTIRMREPSGIQPHLVQAASVVITSTGRGRAASESATGCLWASLARYSDRLVDELEHWEKDSCNPVSMMESSPFKRGNWDRTKMIRTFAQLGVSDVQSSALGEDKRPILTYVLRPLNGAEGDRVQFGEHESISLSENSYALVSPPVEEDASGILLEANRECRIKLFMGEVALGWAWLIPAFHITADSSLSTLVLVGDDIDFAIGVGKALVDMKMSFASDTCKECS